VLGETMTQEIKLALIGSTTIAAILGAYIVSNQLDKRRVMKEQQAQRELEAQTKLKQAEIEGTYPPEYWVAKKAEAEADAQVRQASIESEERLKIDQRNREDADRKAQREFEKDAPESYWAHKRFIEEEETKRRQLEIDDQRRRRLEEQERDIAAKQVRSLEEGTKALEKALRTANYASTIFRY
jgi:hypothetical protein